MCISIPLLITCKSRLSMLILLNETEGQMVGLIVSNINYGYETIINYGYESYRQCVNIKAQNRKSSKR